MKSMVTCFEHLTMQTPLLPDDLHNVNIIHIEIDLQH